jgi:hypothetical protein
VVRVSVAPRASRVPRSRFHHPPTGSARSDLRRNSSVECFRMCDLYTETTATTRTEEQLRMLREDIAVCLHDIHAELRARCNPLPTYPNYQIISQPTSASNTSSGTSATSANGQTGVVFSIPKSRDCRDLIAGFRD